LVGAILRREQIESASPDLLWAMIKKFAEALVVVAEAHGGHDARPSTARFDDAGAVAGLVGQRIR
jgi:hypothetical protein